MSITKTYNFSITKVDENKCREAMQAASDLVKSLPHEDLVYIAELAKRKPNFVSKAKPYEKFL